MKLTSPWYAIRATRPRRVAFLLACLLCLLPAAGLALTWNIETIDSVGNPGYHTSLALDAAGNPRISYRHFTNGDLKYAAWNGSSWDISIAVSYTHLDVYKRQTLHR